jgi:hypothetical protein
MTDEEFEERFLEASKDIKFMEDAIRGAITVGFICGGNSEKGKDAFREFIMLYDGENKVPLWVEEYLILNGTGVEEHLGVIYAKAEPIR